MESTPIDELKTSATAVDKSKIEGVVSSLWAARAASENSQSKALGTLLVEVRAIRKERGGIESGDEEGRCGRGEMKNNVNK